MTEQRLIYTLKIETDAGRVYTRWLLHHPDEIQATIERMHKHGVWVGAQDVEECMVFVAPQAIRMVEIYRIDTAGGSVMG